METLKEIMNKTVLERLKELDGHRFNTAKSLGISIRTLRNHINAMKGDDVEITPSKHLPIKTREDLETKNIFPTNKYRLKYRDKMLNAVTLH